jgi:hypothetical protein
MDGADSPGTSPRALVQNLAAGFGMPAGPSSGPGNIGDGMPAADGVTDRPSPAMLRQAEEVLAALTGDGLVALADEALASAYARTVVAGMLGRKPVCPPIAEIAQEILAGDYEFRRRQRVQCARLGLPPPATRHELERWAAVVLDYPGDVARILSPLVQALVQNGGTDG